MNKQKKVIIAVLTLVVTMMVGYALFSEALTINGTATAKGDFSITATCTPGFSSEIGVSKEEYISDTNLFFEKLIEMVPEAQPVFINSENESGYKNDTCTVNGNNVSIHVDLSYPGAYRLFVVKFTNNGTIPAKIDPSAIWNGSSGIRGDISGGFNSNSAVDTYYQDGFSLFSFENLNFESAGEAPILKTNPVLEPGKSSYAVIRVAWDSNDTGNKRDISIEFDHEFLFTQVTVD